MNRIDELFKNKLEDHSLAPSSTAWAKVEASITKKNKTLAWFRVAACLALASLSWFAYEQISSPSAKSLVVLPATVSEVKTKELPSVKQLPSETNSKSRITKQLLLIEASKSKGIDKVAMENVQSTANAVAIAEPEPEMAEVPAKEVIVESKEIIAQVEKPLVIEYTLESVADQQEEVASRSKLQKVVDFALDAKHSDGALTNLRQAKDDLFAFNFKKDKTKTSKN